MSIVHSIGMALWEDISDVTFLLAEITPSFVEIEVHREIAARYYSWALGLLEFIMIICFIEYYCFVYELSFNSKSVSVEKALNQRRRRTRRETIERALRIDRCMPRLAKTPILINLITRRLDNYSYDYEKRLVTYNVQFGIKVSIQSSFVFLRVLNFAYPYFQKMLAITHLKIDTLGKNKNKERIDVPLCSIDVSLLRKV